MGKSVNLSLDLRGQLSERCLVRHRNDPYIALAALAVDGLRRPVFFDSGYLAKFDDLPFCPAGVVLTRVVSHPADGVFTLDAGSKALSPDTPERGYLLGAEGAKPLLQNEEHWVFSMPKGHEDERPPIGKVMYVVPWHICPTSALYDRILTVRDHEPGEYWTVAARNRF